MSSRACPREKIYFVVNEKHLFKSGLSLFPSLDPLCSGRMPGTDHFRTGLLDNTDIGARLCAVDCPFDPVLSCRSVDNAVCVFHWDDATPAQGVHRCLPLSRKRTGPGPALSDMTVMQNRVDWGETGAAADDAALAPAGFDSTRFPYGEIALKRLLTSAAINMNRSS